MMIKLAFFLFIFLRKNDFLNIKGNSLLHQTYTNRYGEWWVKGFEYLNRGSVCTWNLPGLHLNNKFVIDFVKENPQWQISLQTHKFLNIP